MRQPAHVTSLVLAAVTIAASTLQWVQSSLAEVLSSAVLMTEHVRTMINQSFGEPHTPYEWLATGAEVTAVATHLGISLEPDRTREITESFSRIFVFDDGRKVLKIRARWMTEGRIRFEHALSAHLRANGLPLVEPCDIGGSTWSKVGQLYCEIAPFVDGRHADRLLDDVHAMGELLGRFHACLRSFSAAPYEPPHYTNQVEPRELDAARLAAPLRVRLSELVTSYDELRVSSMPQVIRHGDYHPWNLLFRRDEPGQVAALFDLDMAACGPRIFDVSYALFFLRNLHPEHKADGWDTRFQRFVEGYVETSGMPIGADEAAVIPLLIECIGIALVARARPEDEPRHRENYTALVEWLGYWRKELAKAFGCCS